MDTKEYSKWIGFLNSNEIHTELRNLETLMKISKNNSVLEIVKIKKELVDQELEKRKKK